VLNNDRKIGLIEETRDQTFAELVCPETTPAKWRGGASISKGLAQSGARTRSRSMRVCAAAR
jgi:hypothetical protein